MNSHLRNKQGFTLLELLIAIVILAFLSIGTSQMMVQTFRIKKSLSEGGDFYTQVRVALGIIESDIAMMYSPHMVIPGGRTRTLSKEKVQEMSRIFRGAERLESKFWNPIEDPSGIRMARLQGKDDKISFITSNHQRIYRESRESVFSKIDYQLIPDPEPSEAHEGTSVLIRSRSTNAWSLEDDEDDDPTYRKYTLVKGIKKLVFRFYSNSRAKWYEAWDSEKPEFKNIYPDLVEIEIEMIGPNPKYQFSGTFRFKTEIPINGISASS